MASPTEAEIQDQIRKAVKITDDLAAALGTAAPNFLTNHDALKDVLETDFSVEVEAALAGMRSSLGTGLADGIALLTPLILTYGQFLDERSTGALAVLSRVYRHMKDNALRVTSRSFTRGVPAAAGGNVGNGTLHRLTTDAFGFAIENSHPEAKVALCVADQATGATRDAEQFDLSGEIAEPDRLKITGSGFGATLVALTGVQSQERVSNPSFASFTNTLALPASIVDWTPLAAITNFELDQTNVYRTFLGEGTPTSLVFKANDTIEQDLRLVRGTNYSPTVPIYVQVAFNRAIDPCDGTLTLTFGGSSASVVLAAQAGWNVLRIPLGTANWAEAFVTDPFKLKLALTGRTAGKLRVDDVIVSPFVPHDGTWYALLGHTIPFKRGDKFTFADTEVGAKLQKAFWRYFGAYLPHTTGAGVTWTDP